MQKEIPVYHSIEEVFAKLEPTYGHTFKEYDVNHRLDQPNNKGQLGHIVEEGILGYPINSNPAADLAEIGVEVKTTGVIATKKKEVRAKERLTIDSLNYVEIVGYDFEDSPMWQKADDMLFVFYKYLEGESYGDMPILKAAINCFDETDIAIIKRDYDYILSMIKQGKAEEISEGDTMYLGACTAGHGELVPQPFSGIKAKKRKFCLKQSYFTQLVRKYISDEEFEHAISIDEIREATFEAAMQTNLSRYFGLSEEEIRERFSIDGSPSAKNRYERYIAAMLGVKGRISKTDEFLKANIQLKTIRVNEDGSITESMSFPTFKFTEIVNQDWEESDIYEMFLTTKFMFVVFQERDGVLYFDRIKFWNMSESTMEKYVRPVFEETKKLIGEGKIVKEVVRDSKGKTKRITYFPGISGNPVCHVRPHGQDSSDTYPLPVRDAKTGLKEYTKQCFWLNNTFIADILKK
ncbi:MAG: Sau3AI family type II restriction endonuclease [Candidatus Enteromonas sp.]|nr:Sau3AI family type II restriction endonuclease [Candidatus Enteromonas sp.]